MREMRKKGGKNSGKTRRARKSFRESLMMLLEGKIQKDSPLFKNAKATLQMMGVDGDPIGQDLINIGVFKKAMKGDTFAAEFIRDTVGEKPKHTFEGTVNAPPVVIGIHDPGFIEREKERLKKADLSGFEDMYDLTEGTTKVGDTPEKAQEPPSTAVEELPQENVPPAEEPPKKAVIKPKMIGRKVRGI